MKIAIQGHPNRGEEVIKLLESLGGKNSLKFEGTTKENYYFISKHGHIDLRFKNTFVEDLKCYTLEEFEKEFPFKIGDKVRFKDKCCSNLPVYTITGLEFCGDKPCYLLNNLGFCYPASQLELYKTMKKERNITLTLEKAREWYQKDGELKEIALQAFTEQELNPLPKSWDEFCKRHAVTPEKWVFASCCPQKYVALWKLEQLRDCYRQGWKPDWTAGHTNKYGIALNSDKLSISPRGISVTFLAFQSREVAEEFLKNFESLIKEAGDLI